MTRILKFYIKIIYWILNISLIEKKFEDEIVYKKWFGPDFKIEFNLPYSILLSNHFCLHEVLYHTYKTQPGFVSKASIRNIPFIGYIAEKLENVWLDRIDQNSRSKVFELIQKRQREVMDGTIQTPLLIFPEGAITSGQHILKFKRGAFEALLPVKSFLFKSLKHNVALGILNQEEQLLIDYSRLNHVFEIIELPVLYPTEFMYENYKKINPKITNKSEIFGEVVREVWCEICGFTKSNRGFTDYLEYKSIVTKRKIEVSDYK